MTVFYRFARTLLYPVFRWLSPVKIYGRENIPNDGAFIMASNHTSMSDPFFAMTIFNRQVFFMAKVELFKNWLVRFVISRIGVFAVDRGKGDMSAIRHAEDLINNGKILGIYPEGTRHKEGPPHKAKSGIAYISMGTKADILPVCIYREGSYKFFKKTTIRIGNVLKYGDLVNSELSDRANLKNIVDTVTNKLTELWEMKH